MIGLAGRGQPAGGLKSVDPRHADVEEDHGRDSCSAFSMAAYRLARVDWQLEAVRFTTVIRAWDFRPDSNFVLESKTPQPA